MGFKWFTKGLLTGTLGFAGEESGGASFLRRNGTAWTTDKDGLIVGLLAAEMTARTGTNPAVVYGRITQEVGQSWYQRIDAPRNRGRADAIESAHAAKGPEWRSWQERWCGPRSRPPRVTGAPIGGVKVVADNGWFAARGPSGTEERLQDLRRKLSKRGALARDPTGGAGCPGAGVPIASPAVGSSHSVTGRPIHTYEVSLR